MLSAHAYCVSETEEVFGELKRHGDSSPFMLFLCDWAVLLLSCFSPTREKRSVGEIVGVPTSSRDHRWVSGQRGHSVPPGASIGGVRLAGLQPAQDPLWSVDSRMQTDGAAPKLLRPPASPHGLYVAETPSRNHQLSGESFWSKRSGLSTYAHILLHLLWLVWVDLEWNLHIFATQLQSFVFASQCIDFSFWTCHSFVIQEKVDIDMLNCSIQLRTECFKMMTCHLLQHIHSQNCTMLIVNNNKISICLCAFDAAKPFETKKNIWKIFNDNWDGVKS